jgi:hypothetical protein
MNQSDAGKSGTGTGSVKVQQAADSNPMTRDNKQQRNIVLRTGRDRYNADETSSILGGTKWKRSSAEQMVFRRGLSELPKAERKSKYSRAVIEGRVVSNYVFRLTKYICGGCGEVSIVDSNGEWGTSSSLCVLT